MLTDESSTLEVLEKIAEELEFANRLKILEIVSRYIHISPKNFLKYYDVAIELDEEISFKEKR